MEKLEVDEANPGGKHQAGLLVPLRRPMKNSNQGE